MTTGDVHFAAADGQGRVVFVGEIDIAAVQLVSDDDVAQWVQFDPVTVDLSQCTFIESVGLGLLVRISNAAAGPVHLCGVSPRQRRLLELAALDSLFVIEPTDDQSANDQTV